MKKTVFVVFVVLLSCIVQAQNVRFGVKAGLNTSMLTGSNAIMTSTNGFHVGALVAFKILDKIALQPEVLFSVQGAKIENKDLSQTTLSKMNYVTVPLMVKYYVAAGLFVEAGPQVGFLLTAKDEVQKTVGNTSTVTDVKENYKSIDIAANAGFGYDVLDKVIVQVRYSLGLTNLNEIPDTSETIKSGVFQFSLGYKF